MDPIRARGNITVGGYDHPAGMTRTSWRCDLGVTVFRPVDDMDEEFFTALHTQAEGGHHIFRIEDVLVVSKLDSLCL